MLKPRKDRTREAASKAQTNAATHALHAFSTPMGGKTVAEGMKECVNGVKRESPSEWKVICKFVNLDLMSKDEYQKG